MYQHLQNEPLAVFRQDCDQVTVSNGQTKKQFKLQHLIKKKKNFPSSTAKHQTLNKQPCAFFLKLSVLIPHSYTGKAISLQQTSHPMAIIYLIAMLI